MAHNFDNHPYVQGDDSTCFGVQANPKLLKPSGQPVPGHLLHGLPVQPPELQSIPSLLENLGFEVLLRSLG